MEKFDELTQAKQGEFLEAAAADPLSVLEFEDAATPTLSDVTSEGKARAASSRYAATYPVNASLFGITTGTLGTCSIIHRMSFLYKGSAWSPNKQHPLSYRGTSLVSGWLTNV